ncbi:MAG: hypothetical protein ACYSWO_27685 [Planctomycetota bacterium]|jgi:hypothetical protein
MKRFLIGVVGGVMFGVSLGAWRLGIIDGHTWTDEQKLQAVCGGFAGVVVGVFFLVAAILSPIVWAIS